MKRGQFHIVVLIIICLISADCQKNDNVYIPLFEIKVDQSAGLTTDIFALSITPLGNPPSNEKFHCRWDWEGDSLFNTKFSDDLKVDHRFLKPGNYKVICEVLSLSGGRAWDSLNFAIEQGYSAPKAHFIIQPESGHFRTNFLFDASGTIDDEDSLEMLKFRWDFENDGLWDTPYLDEPTVYHQFRIVEDFTVKLTVMDPGNKSGSVSKVIELHRTDTCIVPDFFWASETGRVGDTFFFNASPSYHQTNPDIEFVFKWLFPDREYTDGSTDPTFEYQFSSSGIKRIVLTVEDGNGLLNTVEKELFVSIENLPPTPKIVTPTKYGNIESPFYLNLWESRDDHTGTSSLLYRWDFDGDGNWDTGKNSEMEIYHQYNSVGTYKCILEAEDEEGLSDTTSFIFNVGPYDYQVGHFKDERDGKLYGTVKIGDYWWMSQNLDYRIPGKMDLPNVQKCYNDDPENCDKYGALYAMEFALSFSDYYEDSICPESWHIPTKKEVDNLIENIEYPNGVKAFIPNGSSGFNALFSGYIIYECIYDPLRGCDPCCYVYHHRDIHASSYFLTSEYNLNSVRPSVYTLNIQTNYAELYPIETNLYGYYSIRCVKDD